MLNAGKGVQVAVFFLGGLNALHIDPSRAWGYLEAMTVASISDAQRDLDALIERVARGEIVTILKEGKAVACLTAPPSKACRLSDQDWFDRMGESRTQNTAGNEPRAESADSHSSTQGQH